MSRKQKSKPISAEEIARLADQGKDISSFFTNTGRIVRPIRQNKKAAAAKSPIDSKRVRHD